MEKVKEALTSDCIKIKDIESTCNHIVEKLRKTVASTLNRRGGVVGISSGIDSSATLALAVQAFGADNVLGVILPESESSSDSERMAKALAKKFGVRVVVENITPALKGFGCYTRRDEAISNIIPEFNPSTDKSKIVIKQDINESMPPVFSVTVITAQGKEINKIITAKEYLQIVASSNFKQRSRMSMLYYHAEANHYAVIGTPNRHEVEQGFFVKHGDGGTDVMPIASLYKSQVYQVAEYLGVPREILERTPTTDTYSAEQTQEEFFFQLPYQTMDLVIYGIENNYSPQEIAEATGRTVDNVNNILRNIERKKKTTDYLRTTAIYF